jgi:hypothetical protein
MCLINTDHLDYLLHIFRLHMSLESSYACFPSYLQDVEVRGGRVELYYCILCTQWACKGSEGSTWGDNWEPEAASTSLNPEKMFLKFRFLMRSIIYPSQLAGLPSHEGVSGLFMLRCQREWVKCLSREENNA